MGIAEVFAVLALIHVTFLSFTRDLWAIGFVFEQRPKPTRWLGIPLAILLIVVGVSLFGTNLHAVFFPLVALGPWLTIHLVRLFAWWRDDGETKRAALEVRTVEALRIGNRAPTLDQRFPWRDYLFDVARVRQQALYEPPPI
ncbi:hypothetical protein [Novosphingobium sp. Rr 2-17]|uniref:hypothetical protein n=1 Tax=Novosphingobium sp. Rr 2-17 TaxID=555793 RepID=UPI001ED95E22|nr:hypothetical protein [Novosphingobium sp. Rr 2-17]